MTDRVVAAGAMFPHCQLRSVGGSLVRLEDYRGRKNLVLVFMGDAPVPGPVSRLLDDLDARNDELESEAAQALVIVTPRPAVAEASGRWTFPILLDPEARLHRAVGATVELGNPTSAVFVTDRFREIYAAYLPEAGSALPSVKEVMNWLTFINIQCPECGVPEWPRS